MPFVETNDVRLYYEIRGSGPRPLFVAGTGSDLRETPNVFDVPGMHGFTVTAYDRRCMGRSTLPEATPVMADFSEEAAEGGHLFLRRACPRAGLRPDPWDPAAWPAVLAFLRGTAG